MCQDAPPAVYGTLTGGGVQVGEAVVLRLGEVERAAMIVDLAYGFHRTPPRSADRGMEVGVWLRGDHLDVVRDGERWQVFAVAADAAPGTSPNADVEGS